MSNRWMLSALIVVLGSMPTTTLCAQAGVSSMSLTKSQAGLSMCDLRIEEFVNYHRHAIPLPKNHEALGLDVRCGLLDTGKWAVQIGLATHRSLDRSRRRPLDLVLVIDRSGSMKGQRIHNVKCSLEKLIRRLRFEDRVSVVSFSENARVDLPACSNPPPRKIQDAIANIETRGGTNLHAGLMLGYRQLTENVDLRRSRQVILLTDGIANVGTTNAETIAEQSLAFNDQGIGLSTIGLGHDFNESLLRKLADRGRGAAHFVATATDINKIFVEDFDSLLVAAAHDIELEIDVDGDAKPRIYGYQPRASENGFTIRMENMNHGATQIVVAEIPARHVQDVNVKLHYRERGSRSGDLSTYKTVEKNIQMSTYRWPQLDPCLHKNISIAKLAQALQRSGQLARDSKSDKAVKKLNKAILNARQVFLPNQDADVDRIVAIANRQLNDLRSIAARTIARAD